MRTDHYAEALQALARADVDSPEMTLRAVIVAAAQVHATLALVDAVWALKAGATATATHMDCSPEALDALRTALKGVPRG